MDKDCGDFDSQKQAQIFFLKNGGPSSETSTRRLPRGILRYVVKSGRT